MYKYSDKKKSEKIQNKAQQIFVLNRLGFSVPFCIWKKSEHHKGEMIII